MTSRAAKLLEDAMRLPEGERAQLAEAIWQSVAPPLAHESDPQWQAEIDRRLDEVKSGKINARTWEQVRRSMSK